MSFRWALVLRRGGSPLLCARSSTVPQELRSLEMRPIAPGGPGTWLRWCGIDGRVHGHGVASVRVIDRRCNREVDVEVVCARRAFASHAAAPDARETGPIEAHR